MRKILYICPSTGVGGAETFIKQTFSQGDRSQFENHYLLFRSGPLQKDLESLGARVHLLSEVPRLSRASSRKKVAKKIIQLINDFNIELVHSTMAYGALFAARPCKQLNVPHVWFQHGPASGWMDRVAAVANHQGLIVNSHYTGKTQRQLEAPVRFLVSRHTPIEKILLGTEVERPSEKEIADFKNSFANKHDLDSQAVWIAMLCRIQSWKGVHVFIEALEKLKSEQLQQPIQGIVWGDAFGDKKYFNELVQQVSQKSLPLLFAGHSQNPALCLASCDILVNASIQPEPFGLSIIEGMMVGAVPVVPDAGGPVEVVSNGKNGMTFSSGQADSLARQLKTLVSDAKLRLRLQTQALETAQQKFSATRAIQHLEKFHLRFLD